MMAKFNFEDYRQPWETGPHWELKKEFIETYEDMFEVDRLLCLAQAYANVVLMSCCYPDPVMRQIAELAKPLKMRKKFQNGSTDEATSTNEQTRDKLKSIYEKTGKRFKQIKFCPSEEKSLEPTLSSNSTNLYESPSEQFKSSNLLTMSNQLGSQALPQASTISSLHASNEPQTSFPSDANIFLEKEQEEKIISALGLPLIQNLVPMIEISQKHKVNAIRALFRVVKQLGINESCYFKFDTDHDNQTNEILYNAKYFIKDCEIASRMALKKKQAKMLCAKAAVDTLVTLSTLRTSSDEVMSQSVFNQASSLDTFSCSLSHPSIETCVEKPRLILNQTMYDLCLRDNFMMVERKRFIGDIQLYSRAILFESASFNQKSFEYKFEDISGTMPPSINQNLAEFTSDKVEGEVLNESATKEAVAKDAAAVAKENKALAILCLSVEENLKNIIYDAKSPSEVWLLLKNTFEPCSRARIATLRRNFMNIKYEATESMATYINRVLESAKDLQAAGKEVPPDEVTYQILEHLPESYENLVIQLYRLPDKEFTVEEVRKQLLAEYDRQKSKFTDVPRNQVFLSVHRNKQRRCYSCGRIGHLRKDCRMNPRVQNSSQSRQRNSHIPNQAHFAAAMISENLDLEFVLDSAATDHFCKERTVFQDFREFKSQAVTAKGTAKIAGIVSEKIKSIYEQSGRPFKQVKFCASKEQYNSPLPSNSTSLQQSSLEKFKESSPLSLSSQQGTQSLSDIRVVSSLDETKEPFSVPNQQGTESLSPKSAIPSFDLTKKDQNSLPIKDKISPEKEKDEIIVSVLGLPFIQNFSKAMKQYASKIGHPVGAILCVIDKLGLGREYSFDVDVDPASPNNKTLYKAKFLIKDCEIASGTACNKKNARKEAAEAAINTLFKLSTSQISSCEEVLQLFNKNIANRIKNEPSIVTLESIASHLGMDDCIKFDIVSSKVSPDLTEYHCKFFLKGVLISFGKDNISDNAKNIAAEKGLMKLSNLSDYEIQEGELQEKPNNRIIQASNSNTLNSNLTQSSTEMCFEKPPFILNQTMYNLSLRDGFVIIEKQRLKADLQNNETVLKKTILYESASFNHQSYEFEFEDLPGTMPPSKKAMLLIAKEVVGTGVGATKEEAKTAACTNAFNHLKKKYYTLRIKEEYVEGFIVTRNQVFDGESFTSNVISESNIGCKMLKSMGWTGGGLGGKGIAEPIQATAKASFGSGVGFEGSKGQHNSQLFRKRMESMLREFCKSENYSDLVFSKDFTKEERKEIHQLAGRFHLHTQSRGVGEERFLTIRQKYETTKLLKFLAKNGGSNSKFELIDDSGTSHQV